MKNIDFLPQHYRNRRLERRARAWELTIAAFFGLLIAGAAVSQWLEHRQLLADETAILPATQRGKEAQLSLQEQQLQLATAGEAAELYLYLQHPWPRTQVLSAVHSALPPETFLTELNITYQSQPLVAPPPDEAEQKRLTKWQRDLMKVRREADRRTALVWLAGETSDSTHVYEFAAQLSKSPLFSTVKLESVESYVKEMEKHTVFKLRGVLKAGYGQADGPGKPQNIPSSVAQRN